MEHRTSARGVLQLINVIQLSADEMLLVDGIEISETQRSIKAIV